MHTAKDTHSSDICDKCHMIHMIIHTGNNIYNSDIVVNY